MESFLQKDVTLLTSHCDHTSHLGIYNSLCLVMDLATEHGAKIGLGADRLAQHGLFWVIARARIDFIRRPACLETVSLKTWPAAPKSFKCLRYASISDLSGVAVTARTEWAMLSRETGRPEKVAQVYPTELVHLEDTLSDAPSARFDNDLQSHREIAIHRVGSQDIDLSMHMNNTAYLRAMLNAIPTSELSAMNVSAIDIQFKHQTYEGELLSVRRCDKDGVIDLSLLKEDGLPTALLRIFL